MSILTLKFKERVLGVYPIVEGQLTIGSDPSCDIHIDSLAVAQRHAVITTRNRHSELQDGESGRDTLVNGVKIDSYELISDDLISIGKHSVLFTYSETEQREEPVGPEPPKITNLSTREKRGWIQILSGQSVGKTISLNRNMTNLGTPGLQTAVISRRNGGYYLSHLEGNSSPLVNETAIGDSAHKLQDGDVILIGNIKLHFTLE